MYSTIFKKQIFTDFLPPTRRSDRIIILCGGMPGSPCKKKVMEFYASQGYWVFFPRYRGTWESGGSFLAKPPHEDVLDILDEVQGPFQDNWTKEQFAVEARDIYIIGNSFGGTVSILASLDDRVTRAVALSPVVDWTKQSKTTEPNDVMATYVRTYLRNAYRSRRKDWDKLEKGNFFNPVSHIQEYEREKLLLIWAADDPVVDTGSIRSFSSTTRAVHKEYARGGHYGSKELMSPRISRRIDRFLGHNKSETI